MQLFRKSALTLVAALMLVGAFGVDHGVQAQALRVAPATSSDYSVVDLGPRGSSVLSALGGGTAGDVHSCQFGTDGVNHCLETLCAAPVRDDDDFICDDVPACFNEYQQPIPCP